MGRRAKNKQAAPAPLVSTASPKKSVKRKQSPEKENRPSKKIKAKESTKSLNKKRKEPVEENDIDSASASGSGWDDVADGDLNAAKRYAVGTLSLLDHST